MLTGYEQVRSVVAAIAGDMPAADHIHLVLPETGACTSQFNPEEVATSSACCGGPAPKEIDACCVADAQAKAATGQGCGCGTAVKSGEIVVEPV